MMNEKELAWKELYYAAKELEDELKEDKAYDIFMDPVGKPRAEEGAVRAYGKLKNALKHIDLLKEQ